MAGEEEIPIKITVDNSQTGPAINQASEQIHQFTSSVDEARNEIRDFKIILIEAFAVDKIVGFIDKMSELGEQIEHSANMTALSAEQTQTLGFAMEMTGGHADEAATVMARFDTNVLQASSGAGAAYEAFVRMRISLDDIRQSTPYELIQKTAAAFERLGPSIQRSADMTMLGGRSFIQLAGAFAEGSTGLQQFHDKLESVGGLLSNQMVANLAETHQGLVTLEFAAKGTGATIVDTLRPAVEGLETALSTFFATLTQWNKDGNLFHELLLDIDRAALVAGASFKTAGGALFALGVIAYDVAHGKLDEAKNALEDLGKAATDAFADINKTMAMANAPIPPSLGGAQGGVGNNQTEAQLKAAQQAKIQLMDEETRTAIQLSNIELQTDKDNLAAQVAAGQITKTQEIEQLKDLAQQEYDIDDAALNDKIEHLKEGTLEYQKAQDQRLLLAAKFTQESSKLDQQQMQDEQKQYDTLFKGIENAMDSTVQGILQGTQTLQQGLARIFDNILIKIIEDMVIKPTVKILEGYAQQIFGNQAKNDAIVASDTAAAGAKGAVSSGTTIAKIEADAAEAYSGVFAWASPLMGPFAAVPAAAAYALVVAKEGLVGSFDTGTDYVPSTGLAMVHEGEAIIPASQNNGGGNMTIVIQAIDTQTGAQFLRNNAATIAQVISSQMRNGNNNLRTALHQ